MRSLPSRRHLAALATVVLVAGGAAGCSGSDDASDAGPTADSPASTAPATDASADPSTDAGDTGDTGDTGADTDTADGIVTTTDRSALPPGLPDDVPVPEGTVQTASDEGNDTFNVEVVVPGSDGTAAADAWTQILDDAGWVYQADISMDTNRIFQRGGDSITLSWYPVDESSLVLAEYIELGH